MSQSEWVYGLHAVQAALGQPDLVIEIWFDSKRQDKRLRQLAEQAEAAGIAIRWLTRREMDRQADGARHQGALAQVRGIPPRNESDLEDLLTNCEEAPFLLVLD